MMSKDLDFSLSDIEGFLTDLTSIIEQESQAAEKAKLIGNLTFYKDGQAKEAVEALKSVPDRYASLTEHYNRLAQFLYLTSEKMTETDQQIAGQIKAEK